MGRVSFTLLGPVAAFHDGRPVELDGPTVKAVLATLLLRGQSGIGMDELITSVWGGPAGATRDSVYHYIRDLRAALAPAGTEAVIVTQRPGYRLEVDDGAVDWRLFRGRVAAARRARNAGELDEAASLLDGALGLWQGPALADVGERLDPLRRDMTDARLAALEDLAGIEADRGLPQRVLDLLWEESRRHPWRERWAELVIDALSALGRRDEAGEVFERTRVHLAQHLGLDPGENLAARYQAALRGTSTVTLRGAGTPPPPATSTALAAPNVFTRPMASTARGLERVIGSTRPRRPVRPAPR